MKKNYRPPRLSAAQMREAAELYLPPANPTGIDVGDILRIIEQEQQPYTTTNMFETGNTDTATGYIPYMPTTGIYTPATTTAGHRNNSKYAAAYNYYNEANEVAAAMERIDAAHSLSIYNYRRARKAAFWLRLLFLAAFIGLVIAVAKK